MITHWHWDHAFGMHAVNGLTVSNIRTNQHLAEYADMISREGIQKFLSLDPSIQEEYANGRPVVVVPADIVFMNEMRFDLGGVSVRLLTSDSPHTDDTTLVLVPEEKILFIGDCISGVFPTWERDPERTRQLIRTLRGIDADCFIGGHWPVFKKEELLNALCDNGE